MILHVQTEFSIPKEAIQRLLSLRFSQRLYRAQNKKRRLPKRTRKVVCLPRLLSCCCQDRERLAGMSEPGTLLEGELTYTYAERMRNDRLTRTFADGDDREEQPGQHALEKRAMRKLLCFWNSPTNSRDIRSVWIA